jgi:hypothetical protein
VNDDVGRDAFERDRPDSPEPDIVTRSVRDDILVHEDLSLFSVCCETLQPLDGLHSFAGQLIPRDTPASR